MKAKRPKKRPKSIEAVFREGAPLDRAMVAAARDAIRRHKQAGVPVAIWRNGKSVFVDPAELDPERRKKRRQ